MNDNLKQDIPVTTPVKSSAKNMSKILIFVAIILGFLTTFVSCFFLSRLLSTEKPTLTSNNPQIVQDSTKFLPGKYYFDDTIMLITKDKPQITLVATVTRNQGDTDYVQNTRVSYY